MLGHGAINRADWLTRMFVETTKATILSVLKNQYRIKRTAFEIEE